jgi:hypothetical protein
MRRRWLGVALVGVLLVAGCAPDEAGAPAEETAAPTRQADDPAAPTRQADDRSDY